MLLVFQVFDLGEKAPDKVLHQLYANLGKLKQSGDKSALEIEKRLRLIVSFFPCFATSSNVSTNDLDCILSLTLNWLNRLLVEMGRPAGSLESFRILSYLNHLQLLRCH